MIKVISGLNSYNHFQQQVSKQRSLCKSYLLVSRLIGLDFKNLLNAISVSGDGGNGLFYDIEEIADKLKKS